MYLAPDPDREGEAIAWHVAEEINVPEKKLFRVLFNEITKRGVAEAMKSPGKIDLNKVDAQQARRVLDRLVGYQVSPLLWKKVKRGLSAGRVQSVALRLCLRAGTGDTGIYLPGILEHNRRPVRGQPAAFYRQNSKSGRQKAGQTATVPMPRR